MSYEIRDTYLGGKDKKSQERDLAYELVEDMYMGELVDANGAEDSEDLQQDLRLEISTCIDQYHLNLEVEDVMVEFVKNWKLRELY